MHKLRLKLLQFLLGKNISIFITQESKCTKNFEKTGFKVANLEVCDAKKRRTILRCELRQGQENKNGVTRIDILRTAYGNKETANM